MASKVRLYVDHPLQEGQLIPLSREQAHYLFGVMRQALGGAVLVFNGVDGEWRAEITQAGKRAGELTCVAQTKPLQMPPDPSHKVYDLWQASEYAGHAPWPTHPPEDHSTPLGPALQGDHRALIARGPPCLSHPQRSE